MFMSSTCKRVDGLGLITFLKEEIFYIQDSSNISDLHVRCSNDEILNSKLTINIKNEKLITIISIKATLSELENGDIPVLHGLDKIFAKTKSITISISFEIENIDVVLVNELLVESY